MDKAKILIFVCVYEKKAVPLHPNWDDYPFLLATKTMIKNRNYNAGKYAICASQNRGGQKLRDGCSYSLIFNNIACCCGV
jgi:hypothetical protein